MVNRTILRKTARTTFNVLAAMSLVVALGIIWRLAKQTPGGFTFSSFASRETGLSVCLSIMATFSSLSAWLVLVGTYEINSFSSIAVSQLGKYAPGTVWPALIQTRLGSRFGIGSSFTLINYALFVGLHLLSGVGIVFILSDRRAMLIVQISPFVIWLLLGFVLVMSCFFRSKVKRLIQRKIPLRKIALLSLCLASFWFFSSLSLLVLTSSTKGPSSPDHGFFQSLSAFASSYVAGMLAFFSPGGLGVREMVLKGSLDATLGTNDVPSIVVKLRVVQATADLTVAASGMALLGIQRRLVSKMSGATRK